MNAATLNAQAPPARSGWVLFDGDCSICQGLVKRWGPSLERRGFALEPLQAPWVNERLKLSEEKLMEELKVIFPGGEVLGGGRAVVYLCSRIWWAWPMWLFSFLPGAMLLINWGYRKVAVNRHCIGGACSIHAHRK